MLVYSSYGARNRHLGGPTTDAGETPSPLEKLTLIQEKTPSDHKLRGRTCWNLHLLRGKPYQPSARIPSPNRRPVRSGTHRGLSGPFGPVRTEPADRPGGGSETTSRSA